MIRKVIKITLTESTFIPTGSIKSRNAAAINPTETAFIPDKEFLILVIFFRSFQKGTINKIKINPGRLIPKTAIMPPSICPYIP